MKKNMPEVKIGLIGVSRDCFPVELTQTRLNRVVKECARLKLDIAPCSTIIRSEHDAIVAAAEMEHANVNAAVIYLGNFGPEGPMTIFAKVLNKPFMLCGAAEENRKSLINGRGDAFCGMLNACLNAGLRGVRPYVPAVPVGLPADIAAEIAHFKEIARVVIGIRDLKVFSFGPRPHDFYACNAPIKPLYNMGIEVMENSELDMLELYRSAAGQTKEIDAVISEMKKELGKGNRYPEKLRQLAQFEIALTKYFEENLGSRQFGVYANKCWPAFEKAFGFVPCFVNSRLASRGIPVACEVDIYGAVSEYMAQLASQKPVSILDVNNTVPADIKIKDLRGIKRKDLFMGFHCGNTPSCYLCSGYSMKYQLIMNRLMEEPGKAPDITCGTLEGTLKKGPVTVFRLQSKPTNYELMSYLAEGRVLDGDPSSFGGIGIIGINNFSRFYRYVLLEKMFPHHTAVAFKHVGKILFDAVSLLGIDDVNIPKDERHLYKTENPF